MATPTYSEVINQVNTFIVTNGNNEITAAVLNPVLKFITDFANNHMGDLSSLTTSETENLVSAINSLKEDLDNSSSNSVKLYTGVENPNTVPPTNFNYADFYMQIDSIDSSPIVLWQWDGFNWVQSSEFEILNNKRGVFTTDGTGELYYNVDYINSLPALNSLIEQIEYTATGGETTIDIGTNSKVKSWFWDGSPQAKSQWTQTGSILNLAFPLTAGSFNIFI